MISGNTPFVHSTGVTISGPSGAEIRYTTDDSDPTAESQLYSESFSLSETTTVKAIAVKDGVSSSVASKRFVHDSSGFAG
ncbi:MAG: chitobiase/beta-hexosaminidase C-terminal domain-containing protein [Bacteroidales bacterium]|nr:chitobiase/beta-hexosaminidase C-terminal domain-containing protein [Bacteroidales bacterium]